MSTTDIRPAEPRRRGIDWRSGRVLAALAGIAAAAIGVGVAELVAAFVGPSSSPLTAVAGAVVDLVPHSLEQFGVQTFGSWDKPLLTLVIIVVLAGVAALAGILAQRRIGFGLGVIAAFAAVGCLAAIGRPDSTSYAVIPTLVGAGAAMLALSPLVQRAIEAGSQRTAEPADVGGAAGSAPGADSESRAAWVGGAAGSAPGADSESRAAWVGGAAGSAPDVPWLGGGTASRRTFFVLAGGTAGAAVVAGGAGRLLARWRGVSDQRAAIRLPKPASPAPPVPPGTKLDVPGISPWTTSSKNFYRVDTAFVLPQVNPETYRLRIHGRVKRELTLTYDDLLGLPLVERDITLACVSNEVGGDLTGNARWLGVRLKDLLDRVEPEAGADQLVGRSADGWTCGTPTAACRDGRDALLAVGMNGEPLPIAHGFPVRMVVPGLYGYVSATKWLVDLELSRFSDFDAYWVPRGWSQQAPIKTSSRIDTPRDSAKVDGTVTVAGVAWAQHRGVTKVEVRVDSGPWQAATLATADSVDTWRQWRWEWDTKTAGEGEHSLEVRATDATGTPQSAAIRPPAPDGSEGYHRISVDVR
ncbi:molybdopterin-dependent oxidoreductase [Cryptosporangium sp. NPDC048952]|uniref:molybdopterin-dependent oxidoreductase n=1 Tax=Cryptosporangium sp. NPDC048952 TaxID=3363961 RepID=UPI003717F754